MSHVPLPLVRSALRCAAVGTRIGPGTLAVIFLLGPVVALAGRLLRLDLHQPHST